MLKKILFLISFSLVANSVMANSTIYTDDLGRMHFLGKDAATVMQTNRIENIEQQKNELNDIIYKNEQPDSSAETPVNNETKVNSQGQHSNKSKGSFTFNKGAMDASDPYTYGETNIAPKNKEPKDTEKKHFWDNW